MRDAEDVVPYRVYTVSFAIRIGATKAFSSGEGVSRRLTDEEIAISAHSTATARLS